MTIPKNHARQLGHLMCAVTTEVLWSPARSWIRKQGPATTLLCRVGSGHATYHRFDPLLKQHQITYGARMIAAKHQADTAAGWLSAREIQRRGYFNGELSTLNLLAHTCCHEFAHLLQQVAGQRYHGSVHNRHFYQILDELHSTGAAEATRNELEGLASDQGLGLSPEPFTVTDIRKLMTHWQVGDAVRFGSGKRSHQGEIVRVNRKTCTVEGTGPSRGLRYRVPVSLLRQLDT